MTSISDKSQPPAMWQVVRNLAIDIKPDIRGFCRQTSPAKTSEPQSFDEWALYLNLGSEYHDEYPTTVGFKIHNVRDTLEVRHRTLLDSVIANLDEAHTALHEAFQAGNAGQIDEWTNQIARIDRHCAEATATIATLVAARE